MAEQKYVFEIQTGKHKGRRIKLSENEALVGRSEEAKIRVGSKDVSREHCILVPTPEGVVVRDLGSSNGTFIDGRPISGEKLMSAGSTLTVGPLTFLLLGGKPGSTTLVSEVAVAGKTAVDDNLSDDDIASWLSSDELPVTTPESDTTIIKNAAPTGRSAPKTPAASFPVESPRKKEFKSVADEARDIIRRHFEMQNSEEG